MLNGSISYNDLRDYYEESGQDDWLEDYLAAREALRDFD